MLCLRLSRDRVLAAALVLTDAGGLEALTMQRLGRALGVEAMSLYRHVANKEDLLDGLVDLVFGEIELPEGDLDWRGAMRRRAVSAREVLRRHPWAIGLMESRSRPGPANLRHHDAVLAVLLGAGFSALQATRAYNLLDSYIYGFALQEKGLPFSSAEELEALGAVMLEQVPAGAYPHLTAVSRELMAARFSYADEFEAGLDLVLAALPDP